MKFKRLVTVKKLDENALIQGLARFGPASIAISVGRKSLKFYSSGVYDDPECSKSDPGANAMIVLEVFRKSRHSRHQRLGSTQGSGKLCLGEHAP